MTVTVTEPTWDEEAREEAWREAQDLMRYAPDAAAQLLARLEAEEEASSRTRGIDADAADTDADGAPVVATPRRGEPYDPSRLYSQLARAYSGWTYAAIDAMHFPAVFAAWREAVLASEEEKAAFKDERRKGKYGYGHDGSGATQDGQSVDADFAEAELARLVKHAHAYGGPVTPARLVD